VLRACTPVKVKAKMPERKQLLFVTNHAPAHQPAAYRLFAYPSKDHRAEAVEPGRWGQSRLSHQERRSMQLGMAGLVERKGKPLLNILSAGLPPSRRRPPIHAGSRIHPSILAALLILSSSLSQTHEYMQQSARLRHWLVLSHF
jgi:hypothetical protein